MMKKASIPLMGLTCGLALMAQATKSQVPDCCSQYNNCVINGGLVNPPDCSLPLQQCVANTGLKPADLPLACAIQVVSYASNLNLGDAVINLTNTGAQGDFDPTGNICANVYTFSPDEQMVSCCSCPITPNGLKSLSVKRDLISNTLTPSVPNSVVIKAVASSPAGGTCNAATVNLAQGLVAWGTTLHARPTGGVALTENAFTSLLPKLADLTRIAQICAFIQANGSGFGICRSCQPGGLGAIKQ